MINNPEAFDLERSTTQAWRRFRRQFANRMADLTIGGYVLVEVEGIVDDEESGCAPYVQVMREDDGLIRVEVCSNHYLQSSHRLDKVMRRQLRDLGFARPARRAGQLNYTVKCSPSNADEVAVMTVRALREVFGVTHPAFLVGDVAIEEDPDLPVAPEAERPSPLLAVEPTSRADLDRMVEEALTPIFGSAPVRDDDGDFPVVSGSAVVFVRVLSDAPVISIFAEVVRDVTDFERARFEVGVLNRDRPFVKFVMHQDTIWATVQLPASPFVPRHLERVLAMMCELVDDVDDDLAVRVSGRRFIEDPQQDYEPESPMEDEDAEEAEDGALHVAMLTLLQLDAADPGSLKPKVAARVCGHDAGLILDLLRWNEEQQIAWREAAEAAQRNGDPDDEAEVCEHEAAHAERTIRLLRKALWLVVQGKSPVGR